MFSLENSLLEMATAGVADGLFYSIVFEEGHNLFIRYFESGVFQGFFENLGGSTLSNKYICCSTSYVNSL